MLAALRATLGYINVSISSDTPAAEVTALKANQILSIKRAWGGIARHTEVAEATQTITELNQAVNDGLLSEAEKGDLRHHLQHLMTSSLRMTASSVHAPNAPQSFRHIYNYLTEVDWSSVLGERTDDDERLPVSLEQLLSLFATVSLSKGCKFPDEKSRVTVVATIATILGQQFSSEQAYALQKKYKEVITHERPTMTHVPYTTVVFPEDANEFVSLFPAIYDQANPPVPCRIDVRTIHTYERLFPCRMTSTTLRSQPPLTAGGLPMACPSAPHPMMQMFQMMQMMQQQQQQALNSTDELPPGFRVLPVRPRHNRSHTGTDPDNQLAIGWSPMPKAHSPPPPSLSSLFSGMTSDTDTRKSPSPTARDRHISDGDGRPHALDDACVPSDVETAADEVDKHLDAIDGGKTRVKKLPGKKTAAAKKAAAKAASKAAAKAAAKATAVTTPKTKAAAKPKGRPKTKPAAVPTTTSSWSGSFDAWDTRPPIAVKCPFVYKNCKVYAVAKGWRVMPSPLSKYDRKFDYSKKDKKTVWADVLAYCEKPSIPATSPNYIKLS
jgi:hypothetical protein